MKADVSSLIGRTFTATSGNTGRVEALPAAGALRIVWKRAPNAGEIAELSAWTEIQLGEELEFHLSDGRDAEGKNLEKFRRLK